MFGMGVKGRETKRSAKPGSRCSCNFEFQTKGPLMSSHERELN